MTPSHVSARARHHAESVTAWSLSLTSSTGPPGESANQTRQACVAAALDDNPNPFRLDHRPRFGAGTCVSLFPTHSWNLRVRLFVSACVRCVSDPVTPTSARTEPICSNMVSRFAAGLKQGGRRLPLSTSTSLRLGTRRRRTWKEPGQLDVLLWSNRTYTHGLRQVYARSAGHLVFNMCAMRGH